ncbi:MAG: L-threonylcarbamoyladenylate synthase [Eggerthellaceae bacterium]|nr:L-threonylcarbamoyladenylate synthase [Eggerthellaceae bacterium]
MPDEMQQNASCNAKIVALDDAARFLLAGKPVVFPTDTVYGLGIAVAAAKDCSQLSEIKQRPDGKPIAWLVGSIEDIDRFGTDIPEWAYGLARAHWPGALTLIVRASDAVPDGFQSKDGTIGLRMPASDIALTLIEACGCPLATTSANVSGNTAPAVFEELEGAILRSVEAVVKGTVPSSGVASTVVDCTNTSPRVLRQGSVRV